MPLIRRMSLFGIFGTGLAGPAQAICSVELAPVAFGVVDPAQRSLGTGEVVVSCDAAASFEAAISAGGAGGATRRMTGPNGGRLDYRLFTDAGRSIPWGDGGSAGDPVAGSSDGGAPSRLTIYGEVPAQAGVEAGEYLDSLEVTLTF